MRRVLADGIDHHDGRDFDVSLTAHGRTLEGRRRLSGERFQILARDAVLLADPDRLQLSIAHIVAHGPDMQAEEVRYLLYGVKLVGHRKSPVMFPITTYF